MRIVRPDAPLSAGEERARAVRQVIEAREAEAKAHEQVKHAEAALAELLAEQQLKTARLQVGNHAYTATVTSRVSHTFDESGLRKALTAKVFDRFTIRKLDAKALKQAVEEGRVDPAVVAQYTQEHTSPPYIQVRSREINDDGEQ
jgi:hypothetical protein